MTATKIYAHLDCSNLTISKTWFEKLFAREPDAKPMMVWSNGIMAVVPGCSYSKTQGTPDMAP
jgi:hypothetical protein